MKDEIKEILDDLRTYKDRYEYFLFNNLSFSDRDYKAKILLDYITNLQEENERYKHYSKTTGIEELMKENEILRKNAEHNDKVVDKAKWNEILYKSRNKKAIEFLEHFDSGQQCEHTKDLAIIIENILQGEDKDDK